MEFFRILLRILTFGLLGKKRSPAEIQARKELALATAQKQLQRKIVLEKRRKLQKQRVIRRRK